ncbi:MAG: SGNH/GDSL hydrolase family protein [Myxococcales bacterium]|nr:SGNH/GDSL hydrolase family protein [Myxococcales bacterium]
MSSERFGLPSSSATLVVALLFGALLLARCGNAPPPVAAPSVASAAPRPTPTPPSEPAAPEPSAAPVASAEPPPEPKRAVTVALIGDSLTDEKNGSGLYVPYLRKKCPKSTFDNFGKGGDMVNQMHRRFLRDVYPAGGAPAKPYTHLVVFGGVNDLYSDLTAGRTPAKVETDLSAMYEIAKKHGAKVVAITVAPWGGFKKYFNESRSRTTHELNDWIRAQPDAGAVDYVVDAYALLSCGDPEKLCPDYQHAIHDGLHFGKGGHEKLGQALYEQVFSSCL